MFSTFTYRFAKGATWGIYIELTADITASASISSPLIPVADDIALAVSPPTVVDGWQHGIHLDAAAIDWLQLGVRLVADEVRARISHTNPLVIHVRKVTIAPCDYQPEGLACAIMGWLAQELGFTVPQVYIQFDKQRNRYVFTFPEPPEKTLAI